MKLKSIINASVVSMFIILLALISSVTSVNAAERFGALTAAEKVQVHTKEMAEVMVLSLGAIAQLSNLNM